MKTLKTKLQARAASRKSYGGRIPDSTILGAPFQIGSVAGRWAETEAVAGLRFAGRADNLIQLRHTGWYVDNFQSETTFGIVYRLPHGIFLAATADPWNGDKDGSGPCILECRPNGTPYTYSTAEEAARAADWFAERYAEMCREDDAKSQAEFQIEDARTRQQAIRTEIRELVADLRQTAPGGKVCGFVRDGIRRLWREKTELGARIAKLGDNYWLAVEN